MMIHISCHGTYSGVTSSRICIRGCGSTSYNRCMYVVRVDVCSLSIYHSSLMGLAVRSCVMLAPFLLQTR